MKPLNLMGLLLCGTLAACNIANHPLVGTWGGNGMSVTFAKDGSFSLREGEKSSTGEWSPMASNLVQMTSGGEEMVCRVASLHNQIRLVQDDSEAASCRIAASFWRMDISPEKRAKSFATLTCEMDVKSFGYIRYTPEYVVEADGEDNLVCLGKTDAGCAFITDQRGADSSSIETVTRWKDNSADLVTIEFDGQSGRYDFYQDHSTNCNANGCTSYSKGSLIGHCKKT